MERRAFSNTKKLWIAIGVYILLIYSTLSLMRDVLNGLTKLLGAELLAVLLNSVLGLSAVLVLIVSGKMGLRKLLWIAPPLGVTAWYLTTLNIPIERVHFLEYGLLGLLVLKALPQTWMSVVLAFVFVTLVGMGDEFIQWLLPNRYGDLRDVVFNSLGGGLGIWVGKVLYSS